MARKSLWKLSGSVKRSIKRVVTVVFNNRISMVYLLLKKAVVFISNRKLKISFSFTGPEDCQCHWAVAEEDATEEILEQLQPPISYRALCECVSPQSHLEIISKTPQILEIYFITDFGKLHCFKYRQYLCLH